MATILEFPDGYVTNECGDHRRVNGGQWGTRRIEHGRIRWRHRTWAPDERHLAYDGRLDGKRALFADYGPSFPDAVELHSMVGEPWPGSDCVDGVFVWASWHPVKEGPEREDERRLTAGRLEGGL